MGLVLIKSFKNRQDSDFWGPVPRKRTQTMKNYKNSQNRSKTCDYGTFGVPNFGKNLKMSIPLHPHEKPRKFQNHQKSLILVLKWQWNPSVCLWGSSGVPNPTKPSPHNEKIDKIDLKTKENKDFLDFWVSPIFVELARAQQKIKIFEISENGFKNL